MATLQEASRREAGGFGFRGPDRPKSLGYRSRRGFRRRLPGFTLVELLVVITIIGMLMALLLPAIQSAREAGRRNTCANNIRNCGTALLTVEGTKRGFPGYVNIVGNKRASWVVTILANLERNDLYQNWINTPPGTTNPPVLTGYANTAASPWAHTLISLLVCPSNPASAQGSNPLSYVCNTGVANHANDNFPNQSIQWAEDINSGVFFNQCGTDANPGVDANSNPNAITSGSPGAFPAVHGGKKVTMDFLSTNDGTSYTLMLTENLQAGNWATDPNDTSANEAPFRNDFMVRQNTGFNWFITGNLNNIENIAATKYNPLAAGINDYTNAATVPLPNQFVDPTMTPTGGLACARPSAAHPGGVNVLFCDNHHRFINEEIAYNVYTQLMTPKQIAVKLNTTGGTPGNTTGWNYILNEADY